MGLIRLTLGLANRDFFGVFLDDVRSNRLISWVRPEWRERFEDSSQWREVLFRFRKLMELGLLKEFLKVLKRLECEIFCKYI